jgi:uncharacterized protein with FMN-binding domain
VVLHLKEVIYTAIFAGLGVLLVILLCWMFQARDDEGPLQETMYVPGVYSTSFMMNDSAIAVEVTVDENHINDISFVNLEESVAVMYPLMESSMEDIRTQIYETQSLENITYQASNQYTTEILLLAIDDALRGARISGQ